MCGRGKQYISKHYADVQKEVVPTEQVLKITTYEISKFFKNLLELTGLICISKEIT